ncbi:Ig-like domain repeat protein [Streptomyces vinaceus]
MHSAVLVAAAVVGCLAPAASPLYAAAVLPPAVLCPTAGICSQAAASLGSAQSVALDGQGNAYVGNESGALYKVVLSTGTRTLVSDSLGGTLRVALDGQGNAYVTNLAGTLYRVTLADGVKTFVTAGLGPDTGGVTLDGEGSAYVVTAQGKLSRVDLATGTTEAVAAGLPGGHGIVLDGQGYAYATDYYGGRLYRVHLSDGTSTVVSSGISGPDGIALDGHGNAYVTAFNNGELVRVNLADGSRTVAATGLGSPTGVALDSQGNAYVTDYARKVLWAVTGLRSATSTVVASAPNPSLSGQEVVSTATVTSDTGVPGGTVTFQDGNNVLGTSPLDSSGQAVLATTALTVGNHSITAVYGGSTVHEDSVSTPVIHVVQRAEADVAVDLSARESGTLNSLITYTLKVTNQGPQAMDSGTFTVTYPAGVTPVQQTQGGLSCDLATGPRTLTCTSQDLPPGTSISETLTTRVQPLTIGFRIQAKAARITSTPDDSRTANDTSTAACQAVTSLLVHCGT